LPQLLLAADVHLITLRDPFVGYVLPSKVHACIQSGKRILFVGSANSDVHLLASGALTSDRYRRVDTGDVEELASALHTMEQAVLTERKIRVIHSDQRANLDVMRVRSFASEETISQIGLIRSK